MQFSSRPHPLLAMFYLWLKDTLAYRADFLMGLASDVIQAGLMIFVWTAIYHFTNTSSILGVKLSAVYVYFFLVSAFMFVIHLGMAQTMQEDIMEGGIASAYTRPIRYPLQAFMKTSAPSLLSVVISSLPLVIIAYLLYGVPVPLSALGLMLAELLIGYALVSLLGFLIGMLAIKLTYIQGVIGPSWAVMLLLGGGTVPLAFFPSAVMRILMLTPFPIMLYMPAATFLGIASKSQIMESIAVSLAWLVGLLIAAIIAWSRASKYITSAGG